MRNIGELHLSLKKWSDGIEKRVAKAEQVVAKKIQEDAKSMAPVKTGAYQNSIEVGETQIEKGKISTEVYSKLKVGGTNAKWQNVPLGAFLEWGTGPLGASNDGKAYEYGYDYRLTPWVYFNEDEQRFIYTYGMVARPHFYPALVNNKKYFVEEIRKAVKDERY